MGVVKVENDGIMEAHVPPKDEEMDCPRCGERLETTKIACHCSTCGYEETIE